MNWHGSKKRRLRLFALAAMTGIFAAALTGCGDDGSSSSTTVPSTTVPTTTGATGAPTTTAQVAFAESIRAAARTEGSVVFYTTATGDGPKNLGVAFEAKYPGIKAEIVTGTPAAILARSSFSASFRPTQPSTRATAVVRCSISRVK